MTQSGQCLPVIYVRGTHYQVGFAMGRAMREQIQEFCAGFSYLKDVLVPFIETDEGRIVYEKYLNGTKQHLPQYIDEIRGLADGCGLPFSQVFVMHIMNEITVIINSNQDGRKSCSTIFVKNSECEILAHNEDGSPEMQDSCFLVVAIIVDDDGAVVEKFTSFIWPGLLPGFAFSYNDAGMVFSLNTLCPVTVPTNTVPEDIFLRSLLRAGSIEELEEMIRTIPGSAQCCSLNVASTKTSEMVNYEFHPPTNDGPAFNRQTVIMQTSPNDDSVLGNGYLFHFNNYERIQGIEDTQRTKGSVRRGVSARALPRPKSTEDAVVILSNDDDTDFPIFRTPRATDRGSTLATAVFDLKKNTLSIYRANPSASDPLLVLPL